MPIEIPEYLDKAVVDRWTKGLEVCDHNVVNRSLLVVAADRGGKYRGLRFFDIGGETHCSVDFQEGQEINDIWVMKILTGLAR